MNISQKKVNIEVYKLIANGTLFERNDDLIWYVSYDIKGLAEYITFECKSIMDIWPKDAAVIVSGNVPVDFFYAGPNKIVSDSVRKIINHKWAKNVEFLPVKVIKQVDGEYLGPYWVLNIIKVLEALDEKETNWGYRGIPPHDEPNPHIGYLKPALKREMVINEGVFRISIRGHIDGAANFITRELKKELVKGKATLGMDFLPIKVT